MRIQILILWFKGLRQTGKHSQRLTKVARTGEFKTGRQKWSCYSHVTAKSDSNGNELYYLRLQRNILYSFGDEQMAHHIIGGGGMVLFESFPVSEYVKLIFIIFWQPFFFFSLSDVNILAWQSLEQKIHDISVIIRYRILRKRKKWQRFQNSFVKANGWSDISMELLQKKKTNTPGRN